MDGNIAGLAAGRNDPRDSHGAKSGWRLGAGDECAHATGAFRGGALAGMGNSPGAGALRHIATFVLIGRVEPDATVVATLGNIPLAIGLAFFVDHALIRWDARSLG
jgi:hypothetical protein